MGLPPGMRNTQPFLPSGVEKWAATNSCLGSGRLTFRAAFRSMRGAIFLAPVSAGLPASPALLFTSCDGLLRKTEIRFLVPDYFQDLSSGSPGVSGFGDLALGVKQQIGPLHGFDLSAILFVSFPTGANGISSHGYDPGLQLPWSHKLSENWTAAGQVAFYWPTQDHRRNFMGETTLLADRQLARPWDVFVEYAGDFPQRGGTRQFLHFGTAYKLTNRQQLDFHVAVGLSDAASRAYIGFGYSFLIVPRK